MAKTVVSTIGSVAATIGSVAGAAMVARSVARDYLPPEFQDYLYFGLRGFINKFSTHLTMEIYEGEGLSDNELYNAAQIYLPDRITNDIHRLKVGKNTNDNKINETIGLNEEFTDIYNEVEFKWCLVSKKTPTREYFNYDTMTEVTKSDERSMVLTFHLKHKNLVMNEYLPFILKYSKTKKQQDKTLKIFTIDKKNGYSKYAWTSVNLDHPSNFTKLAMDPDVKEKVMKDLDRFVARRDYYREVGKAWKRGYLLYGPPGTGKSSLIAAIANYLNFDIYDLELTDIESNSDLRRLLVTTANRSILVVEDIDCSVQLRDNIEAAKRKKKGKITLSGFLNFIDGLWSSCGDERIIIFTTNRKDKLDSALLRPGRMDVHIHMSYCTPSGFRLLASNYHKLTQHNLFEEIEDLIRKVEITPAEVAEQLLKDDDPDIALRGLIEFFEVKKKENEEAKIKAKEEEERLAKEKEKIQEDKLVAKEDKSDAKEDEKKQESDDSNESDSNESDSDESDED
ncbi:AAA-ATPase-like protein [Tanacetum coccineum]